MTTPAFDPSHGVPPPPASSRQRRRVVVALYGRSMPPQTIALARIVAGALHAPLHGLFVWPTPIVPSEVAKLLRIPPEEFSGIVLDVEVGDPSERISAVTAAQPTSFVIMPAEQGGADICGLGEVAARTIAEATTGVIVVRPSASPPHLDRILVPLDGTPSTAAAVSPAAELAQQLGATLEIVMVGQALMPKEPEHGAMTPPQYVDQPQHEWPAFSEEFLQRFLGSICHCHPDVPTRFFLGRGDPAREILHFAQELDAGLIALVWHGECRAGHGEVFRQVMRETDRPVLVLRR